MDRKGETSEVLLGKGMGSMLSIEPASARTLALMKGVKTMGSVAATEQ